VEGGGIENGAITSADHFVDERYGNNRGRLSLDTLVSSALSPDHLALQSVYGRFGKRAFDVLFSLVALTAGSWLYLLIAVAIKCDSRGPVLFRQARVGQDGVSFDCLKFRTMRHQPSASFCQAQKNDPRVTRVGRLLRKTNLDEMPQFINVLIGEMSVVGPRPHVAELDHEFADRVPGYSARTRVRPGVTGLAQVYGCRGETRSLRDMNHRIRFDLFYARNAGLLMDLKIIAATIRGTVLGDRKAY